MSAISFPLHRIDARLARPLGSLRMRSANSPQQGRRLAAVMFTDMVGYSALMRADEALALRLLDEHFRLVRSALRGYRGREIKTIGDSVLISFDSALAALDCAIVVQRLHATRNLAVPASARFEIRVGIHLGDIEHRDGDVFGDGVNVAARVQHLAPLGGLAVTGHVHAQIHGELAQQFRPLGPQALKNIPTAIEVFVLEAATLAGLALERPQAEAMDTAVRRWPSKRRAVVIGSLMLAILGGLALGFRGSFQAWPPLPLLADATTGATHQHGVEAKVSLLEAIAAAQKESGDDTVYHVELEGRSYSVDMARGRRSLNMVIDAADGSVLEKLLEDEDHSADVQMIRIKLEDAVRAALKKAPGVVIEAEMQLLPGRAAVEVRLLLNGEPVLVEVDGTTGEASVVTMRRQ